MIKDFGEKIGLAKKDLWKLRGLIYSDLEGMAEEERNPYVTKANIWPKADMKKELADGLPRFVVYWRNEIRKQVYPTPRDGISHEEYINGVREIKEMVEAVTSRNQIYSFYNEAEDGKLLVKNGYSYTYVPPFNGILSGNTFLRMSREYDLLKLQRKMDKEGFGLSDDAAADIQYPTVLIDGKEYFPSVERNLSCITRQTGRGKYFYYPADKQSDLSDSVGKYMLLKSCYVLMVSDSEDECKERAKDLYLADQKAKSAKRSAKRKKKWTPPQLDLKRTGPDFRCGKLISGEDILEEYGIRGGEFGNWTNDQERIKSLEWCYDSLADLADALDISCKDISLPGLKNGNLAIAFGARGSGCAVAHYEPLLEVINLTRMRGAGSLAHEWGHAMDDLIAKQVGLYEFASEHLYDKRIPQSFIDVMNTIIYKSMEDGSLTDYYEQSRKYGNLTEKSGHGYWESRCELFARAFSCYVQDKLEELGRENAYLCGHSEVNVTEDGKGRMLYAYPRGEERRKINAGIDRLIADMKDRGWFHEPDGHSEFAAKKPFVSPEPRGEVFNFNLTEAENGQLSFF